MPGARFQSQQKFYGTHQMWLLAQLPFALVQRFAYQSQLAVLQIAQPAMKNPRGAAGRSRSKIILFQQQDALARAGTLAGDGDAVNAAADDGNIKMPAIQAGTLLVRAAHSN